MEDSGSLVCYDCGLVVDVQLISIDAEWRIFGDESFAEKEKKSRVGQSANPFLDDNLGTSISMAGNWRNNSYGSNIPKAFKKRNVDRALLAAFNSIDDAGNRISLPDSVLHRAKYLYNQMYRNNKLKGNIIIFLDPSIEKCEIKNLQRPEHTIEY